MHIQMSCLIIKTVNLAVITAVALAPGVFWLEDVLRLGRNTQTLKSLAHILSCKPAKNCINIICEQIILIVFYKRMDQLQEALLLNLVFMGECVTMCNHY